MRDGRQPSLAQTCRRNKASVLLALTLTLLASFQQARAEGPAGSPGPEITLQNIASSEDAEASANRLIGELRRQAGVDPAREEPLPNAALGGKDNPLLILHVGSEIPSELKWVMLKLDAAEIRFDARLVTPEQLESEVTAAAEQGAPEFLRELRYAGEEGSKNTFLKDWARAQSDDAEAEKARLDWAEKTRLKIRQTIGLANGLTYWAHVPRSEEIRTLDLNRAVQSGGISAISVSVATYIHQLNTGDAMVLGEMLRSAGTIGVWVFGNMYYFRALHEVMSQGKTLSEPAADGSVKVVASTPFFWTTNYLRSMCTNAFIKLAASGTDALEWDTFWRSHWNSLAGVFARSKIDKWISDRTPTRRDADGNLVVLSGQWSAETAARVNFWWNNVYGFLKNLQFLGLQGPAGIAVDAIYYGLMVFNVSWTAYDAGVFSKAAAALRRAWLPEATGTTAATDCATLLIGRVGPGAPRMTAVGGGQ